MKMFGLSKWPTSGEVKIWESLCKEMKKILAAPHWQFESPVLSNLTGARRTCVSALPLREYQTIMPSKTLWIWSGYLTRIKSCFRNTLGMKQRLDLPCSRARSELLILDEADQRPRSHRYCRSRSFIRELCDHNEEKPFNLQSHFGRFPCWLTMWNY